MHAEGRSADSWGASKTQGYGGKRWALGNIVILYSFSPAHSNSKSSSLADTLSGLGNSLQFTLAASSPAVTQQRGMSSDPEHHVCCHPGG